MCVTGLGLKGLHFYRKKESLIHIQPLKTLASPPPYHSSSALCTSCNFCNNGAISKTVVTGTLKKSRQFGVTKDWVWMYCLYWRRWSQREDLFTWMLDIQIAEPSCQIQEAAASQSFLKNLTQSLYQRQERWHCSAHIPPRTLLLLITAAGKWLHFSAADAWNLGRLSLPEASRSSQIKKKIKITEF